MDQILDSHRVTFPSRSGHTLVGRAVGPASITPRAWALLVHCFTCGKDLKGYHHLARTLTGEGLASLRFDLSGLGESGGDFAASDLDTNVADVVDAAAYLRSFHAPPQLLIGHSLGGVAALSASAHLPSVRAVVLIGTPSNVQHLVTAVPAVRQAAQRGVPVATTLGGRRVQVGPGLYPSLLRLDLADTIKNLRRPLLVVHGSEDEVVSQEHATALLGWADAPAELACLEGADHLLSNPRQAAAAARLITAWSTPHLTGDAPR